MKESMWGYWIIILGIAILSVMMLLQNYSTTDEQSFFLTKENLSSAMRESIDYGYYADTLPVVSTDKNDPGYYENEVPAKFKINREKLIENFIRRFAETVDINKTYTINFYYISEMPPAASVEILAYANSSSFAGTGELQVSSSSRFTGILYTTEQYKPGWTKKD